MFSDSSSVFAHQDEVIKSPGLPVIHFHQTMVINNPVFQQFTPGSKSNPPLIMYAAFHLLLHTKIFRFSKYSLVSKTYTDRKDAEEKTLGSSPLWPQGIELF